MATDVEGPTTQKNGLLPFVAGSISCCEDTRIAFLFAKFSRLFVCLMKSKSVSTCGQFTVIANLKNEKIQNRKKYIFYINNDYVD